jgi:hypothetical protein
MTFGFIYKIKFPNGKHYIGLTTTSLEQRTKEHKKCAKGRDTKCLYNALRKYNMIDTFELIEIDTSDTVEELCEKEIRYILEYNSHYIDGYGYNMTYGGDGTNGYLFTEEDKQKIRETLKKYHQENPEAGKEHSERLKKYYENPEAIQKNSEALKRYYEEHPESAKAHSERMKKRFEDNPNLGKEHGEKMKKYYENPEARKKNSEICKKYWEDPDARKEQSEMRKKYYEEHPEARQKYSEALKKYYQENQEARQKNSEALKKYYQENPEAKQKNSEALKKYYEEHPESAKEHGERMKKYYQQHPELGKAHSEALKKYYAEHPELGKEHSERMKKRFEDNPNLGKEHGERMKKYYENPEARQKNRDAQKNRSPEWIKKKLDVLGQNKPFDVFTVDGTFIKTFTYQYEAKEYLQKEHNAISNISILKVLTGHLKSSAGFVFKYK